MSEVKLYIGGNPMRHYGFLDIVGEPCVQYVNRSKYGSHLGDKSYYILCHDKDYVHYALIDKTINCADTDDFAQLEFWLSVPKGKKLIVTPPSQLLKIIRDKFIEQYTTSNIVGISACKALRPEEYDKTLFESIVAEVALTNDYSTYMQMAGDKSGYVRCIDENNIDQLLSDTQYEEFTSYREIIVSTLCLGRDNELLNIEIPRRHKYTIFYDGSTKFEEKYLQYDSDEFSTSMLPHHIYEYEPLSFTLGELKAAGGVLFGGKVTLDCNLDSITCTLDKEERKVSVRTKVIGDTIFLSALKSASANNEVSLSIGTQKLNVEDFISGKTIKVPCLQMDKEPVATCDKKGYKLNIQKSLLNNQYTITLEVINLEARRQSGLIGQSGTTPTQDDIPNDVVRLDIGGLPKTGIYDISLVQEEANSGETLVFTAVGSSLSHGKKKYVRVTPQENRRDGKGLLFIMIGIALLLCAGCLGLGYWWGNRGGNKVLVAEIEKMKSEHSAYIEQLKSEHNEAIKNLQNSTDISDVRGELKNKQIELGKLKSKMEYEQNKRQAHDNIIANIKEKNWDSIRVRLGKYYDAKYITKQQKEALEILCNDNTNRHLFSDDVKKYFK